MRNSNQEAFLRAQHEARYQMADTNGKLTIMLRNLGHTLRYLLYEGKGSQTRILTQLLDAETITQRDLTTSLDIQPGSVSEVLSKLENAGLILRTPSATDGRTSIVSLTEAGINQAAQLRKQRKQMQRDMFACLTEEEKASLLVLLRKVNDSWSVYSPTVEEKSRHTKGSSSGVRSQ